MNRNKIAGACSACLIILAIQLIIDIDLVNSALALAAILTSIAVFKEKLVGYWFALLLTLAIAISPITQFWGILSVVISNFYDQFAVCLISLISAAFLIIKNKPNQNLQPTSLPARDEVDVQGEAG